MKECKFKTKTFSEMEEDYQFNFDIMTTEAERTAKLKYIINHKLSQADKTIIVMYAECGSLRVLGNLYGVSHTFMAKIVNRIRSQILEEYRKPWRF